MDEYGFFKPPDGWPRHAPAGYYVMYVVSDDEVQNIYSRLFPGIESWYIRLDKFETQMRRLRGLYEEALVAIKLLNGGGYLAIRRLKNGRYVANEEDSDPFPNPNDIS